MLFNIIVIMGKIFIFADVLFNTLFLTFNSLLIMKNLVSVTRFDNRSTRENPVRPDVICIERSQIADVVDKFLDENHTLLFQSVETSFAASDSSVD